MEDNVLVVKVLFNRNDMNKTNLKKCIWLIRGVMTVEEIKNEHV